MPAPREAGPAIPLEALAVLRAEPPGELFDQVIPLLTVDSGGYPHVALLSRAQLQNPGTGHELLAVVWGSRTKANLMATRRATVILVGGQVAWYLKLGVVRTLECEGRLGVVLRLAGCNSDSAGVDLAPMGFRHSTELAQREGWDADQRVLALLAGLPDDLGGVDTEPQNSSRQG